MPFDSAAPALPTTDVDATPAPMTRRAMIAAERLAAQGQQRGGRSSGSRATDARSADTRGTDSRGTASRPSDSRGTASRAAVPRTARAPLAGRAQATGASPAVRRRTSFVQPVPDADGIVSAPSVLPVAPPRNRAAAVRRAERIDARSSRSRGSAFRRNASRVTGAGALLFVAGLVVSTSLPAQAFFTADQVQTPRSATAASTQSLRVGSAAEGSTARDAYTVTAPVAPIANTSDTFTNDANGSIQWPFPVGVPITSGFGARNVEGCSFCSTFHEGVDFAPGAGTAIHVVAAGTVIKVKADDGGYGNDVWVQHDVDGKQFVSVYGHMLDGSFKVVQGQQVNVGDELGLVGSTGNSTGPHLHLEIHVDGVPVDPLAWLRANAN